MFPGSPSVFKHVLYIIKENRTYDQIFGDLTQGDGDPSLVHFGRDVTPNHHALAEQFVLLDNFYCSGILSADGHQWATQAFVTDYIEKSFGGFNGSYPYDGDDPMAYAASGFIWDNAIRNGKTLRVHGEFAISDVGWTDPRRPGKPTFADHWSEFTNRTGRIRLACAPAIESLRPREMPLRSAGNQCSQHQLILTSCLTRHQISRFQAWPEWNLKANAWLEDGCVYAPEQRECSDASRNSGNCSGFLSNKGDPKSSR